MNTRFYSVAAAALLFVATTGASANDSFEGTARDAWISGKIETVFLLNRHLNNFQIDTDVENGAAILTGVVESKIDRDLAGELAKGVDGVVDVRNELIVDAEGAKEAAMAREDSQDSDSRRTFGTWVDDATTTAAVKSKLVANSETKGLEIDVDTHEDVVTLTGRVQSDQVKELAAQIAMNTGDVADVRNNLVVDPE